MFVLFLVLILVIGITIVFVWDEIRVKKEIKYLEQRDEHIIDVLEEKYRMIPDRELCFIYEELDWVCQSLFNEVYADKEHRNQLIMQGLYAPLHPVGEAKAKLQRLNNRYGWSGENMILFTTKSSANGVYENRYFLAQKLDIWHGGDFHFYED